MLVYALAATRSGAPLDRAVEDALRDRTPAGLPFAVGNHRFWSNPSGSVALAAWQDTLDDSGTGGDWLQSDGRLTAFSGRPLRRDRPWSSGRPWVAQLAEHLQAHPLDGSSEELLGVFTALSLDEDGRGTVASDPLGIGLIYQGQSGDTGVIASRANLVATLLAAPRGAAPRRDALGTCWLAYSVYPVGTSTAFEGVEAVPAGARVEVDPKGGLRTATSQSLPWLRRPERREDRESMVESLREDIASGIHAALELPVANHLANLTGGKDSRLILAVMLAEGVAEEFEFRTWGSSDLPDVLIAGQIAERFNLRHEVNAHDPKAREWREARDVALREAGYGDVPRRELVLRLAAGSWFGMRNVAEPRVARAPFGDSLLVSGLCGEILRTNFPGAARLGSMEDVDDFTRNGLNYGAAGILRPDALRHYDDEIRRLVHEDFAEGDSPQDAIDAFYVRGRLRRWFGTGQEVDEDNRLFPLYSSAGIRSAFAIGAVDRHAEWLHYEITNRACEPLARMPFDRGGWDERLTSAGPAAHDGSTRAAGGTDGSRTARKPAPRQPVRTVMGEKREKMQSTDVEIMRRYLVDERSNPVFEVVDPDACAAAVDHFGELSEAIKGQVYGALTAAIWLGGSEITWSPDQDGDGSP